MLVVLLQTVDSARRERGNIHQARTLIAKPCQRCQTVMNINGISKLKESKEKT